MNKNIFLLVGFIILAIAGTIFMTSNKSTTKKSNSMIKPTVEIAATATKTPETANVKEFTIQGSNMKFDVNEIKVKKGDTVKIIFKNIEGFHDWKIDEFNAATPKITAGKEETVQFVVDKAGTFEYYCSVGSHRQMGMKGNLIVEE